MNQHTCRSETLRALEKIPLPFLKIYSQTPSVALVLHLRQTGPRVQVSLLSPRRPAKRVLLQAGAALGAASPALTLTALSLAPRRSFWSNYSLSPRPPVQAEDPTPSRGVNSAQSDHGGLAEHRNKQI